MHRFATKSLLKLASGVVTNSSGHMLSHCTAVKACKLANPMFASLCGHRHQTIHTSSKIFAQENIFNRTYDFFDFHFFKKYLYRGKAYLLYRHAIDNVDHLKFINDYRMPDTFFSWFIITELHVWMLMVRLMAGKKDGFEMRKNLVGAMWQDADVRKKKLGGVKTSVVQPHMQEMGMQFNAAIIGYDEGLMTNDQVLAGAVWRRFFQSECNNPEQVEKLVIYIRKTINMLDKLPFNAIMQSNIEWLDHRNC